MFGFGRQAREDARQARIITEALIRNRVLEWLEGLVVNLDGSMSTLPSLPGICRLYAWRRYELDASGTGPGVDLRIQCSIEGLHLGLHLYVTDGKRTEQIYLSEETKQTLLDYREQLRFSLREPARAVAQTA